MLTKEEKLTVIQAHAKNLAYSRYNLEIDTVQENAKASPDQGVLSSIAAQMAQIDAQITALNAEKATVEALTE